jgi:RHS repeat-associated protein
VVQEVIGGTNTANSLSGGIDEVFQRTDSAGARSFLRDPLGSSIALADSTGTVQTSYSFEPFGNTIVTGPPTTNTFGFTGRELDSTGLYFYRARYYSPNLQRFVSEDPIGFAGGSNEYQYAGDNPISFVDAFGLDKNIPNSCVPPLPPSSWWPRTLGISAGVTAAAPLQPTSSSPDIGVPSAGVTVAWAPGTTDVGVLSNVGSSDFPSAAPPDWMTLSAPSTE